MLPTEQSLPQFSQPRPHSCEGSPVPPSRTAYTLDHGKHCKHDHGCCKHECACRGKTGCECEGASSLPPSNNVANSSSLIERIRRRRRPPADVGAWRHRLHQCYRRVLLARRGQVWRARRLGCGVRSCPDCLPERAASRARRLDSLFAGVRWHGRSELVTVTFPSLRWLGAGDDDLRWRWLSAAVSERVSSWAAGWRRLRAARLSRRLLRRLRAALAAVAQSYLAAAEAVNAASPPRRGRRSAVARARDQIAAAEAWLAGHEGVRLADAIGGFGLRWIEVSLSRGSDGAPECAAHVHVHLLHSSTVPRLIWQVLWSWALGADPAHVRVDVRVRRGVRPRYAVRYGAVGPTLSRASKFQGLRAVVGDPRWDVSRWAVDAALWGRRLYGVWGAVAPDPPPPRSPADEVCLGWLSHPANVEVAGAGGRSWRLIAPLGGAGPGAWWLAAPS